MEGQNIFKRIIIILSIVSVVGIIGICAFAGIAVFKNTTQLVDNDSTDWEAAKEQFQKVNFDLENFQSKYDIETIQIESTLHEHKIPLDYITIDGNKNKDTVVIIHGLGGSRWTNYPISTMFLENGYNVISYDQRSSGENLAGYTTYGYYESDDLEDVISYLIKSTGGKKEIGIHGASLGGATAGMYLSSEQANEYVDFTILENPLSSMEYLIYTVMKRKNIGLPLNFLMAMGNTVNKLKLGFSYKDAEVVNYINTTDVPTLVINSRVDQVTPYFMGEDIYKAIPHSEKYLFTVEDSRHGEIYFDYPNEIEEIVFEFIEKTS